MTAADYEEFMKATDLTNSNRRQCFNFVSISDGVAENTETLKIELQGIDRVTLNIASISNSREMARVFISKYNYYYYYYEHAQI